MHKEGNLTTMEFLDLAKYIVENEFYDSHPDINGAYDVAIIRDFDLPETKEALLCVPKAGDDRYYEVVYYKAKHELLFTVYKKQTSMKFDSYDIEYYFMGEDEE